MMNPKTIEKTRLKTEMKKTDKQCGTEEDIRAHEAGLEDEDEALLQLVDTLLEPKRFMVKWSIIIGLLLILVIIMLAQYFFTIVPKP